jgi:hypothetical protein
VMSESTIAHIQDFKKVMGGKQQLFISVSQAEQRVQAVIHAQTSKQQTQSQQSTHVQANIIPQEPQPSPKHLRKQQQQAHTQPGSPTHAHSLQTHSTPLQSPTHTSSASPSTETHTYLYATDASTNTDKQPSIEERLSVCVRELETRLRTHEAEKERLRTHRERESLLSFENEHTRLQRLQQHREELTHTRTLLQADRDRILGVIEDQCVRELTACKHEINLAFMKKHKLQIELDSILAASVSASASTNTQANTHDAGTQDPNTQDTQTHTISPTNKQPQSQRGKPMADRLLLAIMDMDEVINTLQRTHTQVTGTIAVKHDQCNYLSSRIDAIDNVLVKIPDMGTHVQPVDIHTHMTHTQTHMHGHTSGHPDGQMESVDTHMNNSGVPFVLSLTMSLSSTLPLQLQDTHTPSLLHVHTQSPSKPSTSTHSHTQQSHTQQSRSRSQSPTTQSRTHRMNSRSFDDDVDTTSHTHIDSVDTHTVLAHTQARSDVAVDVAMLSGAVMGPNGVCLPEYDVLSSLHAEAMDTHSIDTNMPTHTQSHPQTNTLTQQTHTPPILLQPHTQPNRRTPPAFATRPAPKSLIDKYILPEHPSLSDVGYLNPQYWQPLDTARTRAQQLRTHIEQTRALIEKKSESLDPLLHVRTHIAVPSMVAWMDDFERLTGHTPSDSDCMQSSKFLSYIQLYSHTQSQVFVLRGELYELMKVADKLMEEYEQTLAEIENLTGKSFTEHLLMISDASMQTHTNRYLPTDAHAHSSLYTQPHKHTVEAPTSMFIVDVAAQLLSDLEAIEQLDPVTIARDLRIQREEEALLRKLQAEAELEAQARAQREAEEEEQRRQLEEEEAELSVQSNDTEQLPASEVVDPNDPYERARVVHEPHTLTRDEFAVQTESISDSGFSLELLRTHIAQYVSDPLESVLCVVEDHVTGRTLIEDYLEPKPLNAGTQAQPQSKPMTPTTPGMNPQLLSFADRQKIISTLEGDIAHIERDIQLLQSYMQDKSQSSLRSLKSENNILKQRILLWTKDYQRANNDVKPTNAQALADPEIRDAFLRREEVKEEIIQVNAERASATELLVDTEQLLQRKVARLQMMLDLQTQAQQEQQDPFVAMEVDMNALGSTAQDFVVVPPDESIAEGEEVVEPVGVEEAPFEDERPAVIETDEGDRIVEAEQRRSSDPLVEAVSVHQNDAEAQPEESMKEEPGVQHTVVEEEQQSDFEPADAVQTLEEQPRESVLQELPQMTEVEQAPEALRLELNTEATNEEAGLQPVQEEQERQEREKEQARLEQLRLEEEEQQRLLLVEAERLEQIRLEKELQLQAKREREERERLFQEKLQREQERLEQERQEQLEKYRAELEQVRVELEKQRLEQARLDEERQEKERLEHERLENERLERERVEQERSEQLRVEEEQRRLEHERMERELRQQREQAEAAAAALKAQQQKQAEEERRKQQLSLKLAEEQAAEQERIRVQQAEKERLRLLEQQRLEQERLEKERLEQQRLEQQRLIEEETARKAKAEVEAMEQERQRQQQEQDTAPRRSVRTKTLLQVRQAQPVMLPRMRKHLRFLHVLKLLASNNVSIASTAHRCLIPLTVFADTNNSSSRSSSPTRGQQSQQSPGKRVIRYITCLCDASTENVPAIDTNVSPELIHDVLVANHQASSLGGEDTQSYAGYYVPDAHSDRDSSSTDDTVSRMRLPMSVEHLTSLVSGTKTPSGYRSNYSTAFVQLTAPLSTVMTVANVSMPPPPRMFCTMAAKSQSSSSSKRSIKFETIDEMGQVSEIDEEFELDYYMTAAARADVMKVLLRVENTIQENLAETNSMPVNENNIAELAIVYCEFTVYAQTQTIVFLQFGAEVDTVDNSGNESLVNTSTNNTTTNKKYPHTYFGCEYDLLSSTTIYSEESTPSTSRASSAKATRYSMLSQSNPNRPTIIKPMSPAAVGGGQLLGETIVSKLSALHEDDEMGFDEPKRSLPSVVPKSATVESAEDSGRATATAEVASAEINAASTGGSETAAAVVEDGTEGTAVVTPKKKKKRSTKINVESSKGPVNAEALMTGASLDDSVDSNTAANASGGLLGILDAQSKDSNTGEAAPRKSRKSKRQTRVSIRDPSASEEEDNTDTAGAAAVSTEPVTELDKLRVQLVKLDSEMNVQKKLRTQHKAFAVEWVETFKARNGRNPKASDKRAESQEVQEQLDLYENAKVAVEKLKQSMTDVEEEIKKLEQSAT